jgi:integrase
VNRALELYLIAPLGDRPLDSIRRDDLKAIIDAKIAEGHDVMANRLRTYIRHFFRWACASAEIENPAAFLEKETAPERPRDRVLKPHEIKIFWIAADTMPAPFGDLAKFLLLTGARRGEAAGARWEEFDLDAALWTCPASRQKTGKPNKVPLSASALAIIKARPRLAGSEYVFATGNGKPLSNWSRCLAALNAKMQKIVREGVIIERVTLHDLRRTMRSGLDELGVRHVVGEAILNHEVGSAATQAYTHAEMIDEKRRALNLWADQIARTVG